MQGQKLEADNYFDSGAHYVPDWTKICCRGVCEIGCRGWLRVMLGQNFCPPPRADKYLCKLRMANHHVRFGFPNIAIKL
jgi:hypothetical protein